MFNRGVTRFRERVGPSLGIWLAILLLVPGGLLIFLPIGVGVGIAGAAVLLAIGVGILVAATPTVEVTEEGLRAGRARLPARYIGAVEAITGEDAVHARGPGLDARAWLMIRGWARDVVRVEDTDADDPVPYWLVSTRRAEELAAALDAARDEARTAEQ